MFYKIAKNTTLVILGFCLGYIVSQYYQQKPIIVEIPWEEFEEKYGSNEPDLDFFKTQPMIFSGVLEPQESF